MSPLQQLQLMLNERYVSEDGDGFKVELRPGLNEEQMDRLAKDLPGGQIPADVRELLRFAKGFEFYGLEEITFDGVGMFGFENFFPNSVQLAGDGLGNFWIVDVSDDGKWNNIFYVCHDPAVVVRHSNDLSEFIKHIDEFGKKGSDSYLDLVIEKIVGDIWRKNHGFIDIGDARSSPDETLREFAAGLADRFVIADLRNKPNGAGFAYGKFGPHTEGAVRHGTELIWGIETHGKQTGPVGHDPQKKKGFFSKLFGR